MIATGGEGEEGEKVNLKICLAGELDPGLQYEKSYISWVITACIRVLMKEGSHPIVQAASNQPTSKAFMVISGVASSVRQTHSSVRRKMRSSIESDV